MFGRFRSGQAGLWIVWAAVCLINLFWAPIVSADSLSYTVTAVVNPSVEVVVTKTFTIEKIISNSSAAVTPTVYRGSATGPQLPMTRQVYRQYARLTDNGRQLRDGVVYDAANQPSSKPAAVPFNVSIIFGHKL